MKKKSLKAAATAKREPGPLTEEIIQNAIDGFSGKGEKYEFDSTLPGFAVRLRGKTATYVLCYRAAGRSQKFKIGEVGALPLVKAWKIAQAHYGTVQAGGNPAAEKRAQRESDKQRIARPTVATMLDKYLSSLALRVELGKAKGRRTTLSAFTDVAERHIKPELGGIHLDELTREQVAAWHNGLAHIPTTANRAAAVARTAYAHSLKTDKTGKLSPANPFKIDRADKYPENRREEVYSLADVRKLGAALRDCIADGTLRERDGLSLKLFLFTGMRRGEIFGQVLKDRRSDGDGLHWGDVDLDAGVIRLRRAKTGPRPVTLPAVLIDALRAMRPADARPDDFVIAGRAADVLFVTIEQPFIKLFKRAGLPFRGCHAFRKTFTTTAAELGINPLIVDEMIGHSSGSMTARYVVPKEGLRLAAERVAGEIAAALDGKKEAKVLEFSKHIAETH